MTAPRSVEENVVTVDMKRENTARGAGRVQSREEKWQTELGQQTEPVKRGERERERKRGREHRGSEGEGSTRTKSTKNSRRK